MATVLLGWELGAGFGHVKCLLAVANALAEHGHVPVLSLKNVVEPFAILRDIEFKILQAPVWPEKTSKSPEARSRAFPTRSYSDILALRGFDSADGIESTVRAWDSLIDLVNPGLVVGDHSPTLCLAAFGKRPSVVVGNGFCVPPSDADAFPPLAESAQSRMSPELMLQNVQEVQRRRGLPAPQTLPGLFSRSSCFVTSLRELDPYRAHRPGAGVGPLGRLPSLTTSSKRQRYFAYLSGDWPLVEHVMGALSATGLQGMAYLRGLPGEKASRIASRGTQLLQKPADFEKELNDCAVVVHHGGTGTSEVALASGCAQLILPRHLEQRLTADALGQMGVATVLTGRCTPKDVSDALLATARDENMLRNAFEWATRLSTRDTSSGIRTVTEACLKLIRK